MRADTRGDRTFCMSVTTAIAVHMNLQLIYGTQYYSTQQTASEAVCKKKSKLDQIPTRTAAQLKFGLFRSICSDSSLSTCPDCFLFDP